MIGTGITVIHIDPSKMKDLLYPISESRSAASSEGVVAAGELVVFANADSLNLKDEEGFNKHHEAIERAGKRTRR